MLLTINSLKEFREQVCKYDEIREMNIGHGVISFCYMISSEFTFDNLWCREARGICFDAKTGKVIARPLHKFFNIGERPETRIENLDFKQNFRIMPKRDGSMIHTVLTEDGVKLKSKKSFESEVAKAATSWLANHNQHQEELFKFISNEDITLIFEFTSPTARIVLPYSEPKLTLLHIRDNVSGQYWARWFVESFADQFGFDVDADIGTTAQSLVENGRSAENIEGWVFQFPETGNMVKLKTDWYLKRHRAITFLRERDVAELVLDEGIDDLKAMLVADGIDIKPILDVESEVVGAMKSLADLVKTRVEPDRQLSRKDFAIKHQPNLTFSLEMQLYLGQEPKWVDFFKKNILKQTFSLTQLNLVNSVAEKD